MLKAHVGKLRVHQVASAVAADVVRLARSFRGPGAFARGDQIVRAALSVSSNIAEACGRGTTRDFRRFLVFARGSAQELLSQLQLAREVDPGNRVRTLTLEHRTGLVLKMLRRLYDNPPPEV